MNALPIHLFPEQPEDASETASQFDMLAAGLLVIGSAPYLWLLPQAFHTAPVQAVLLGSYVLLHIICALDIKLYSQIFGWFGGALVCAGSLLAYLASLIFGGPLGWHTGIDHFGLFSIVVHALFLLLFVNEIVLSDEED